MFIKYGIAAVAAGIALTPLASAQVFVIGGGLGGECYQQTQLKYVSYNQAEETCTLALREETMSRSNRAATHVNRGVLRMRNGDYDKALSDFDDAKRIAPDLGAAYLNEGAAHIYKRDFEAALAPLDKAIELNSEDIFAAYYNRAIARENTGDVPGAYADFKTSLELKPGWELAQSQLNRFSVQSTEG